MGMLDITLFSLILLLVSVESRFPSLKTSYFDQYVDHFNFGSYNNQKYKQRYLYTESYWKPGSPLLFYTGNEGDISSFAANTGLMFEFAQNLSAYVVFAEHRYYGESLPFGNSSLESDKLGLLTMEQAMADYAYLIKSLKKTILGKKTPVICFGGSYGGMLSAYMRFKYPNVVQGAIASSAPIYSTANLVDQGYFFQDVAKDFENANMKCPSLIKSAFDKIGQLANQGKQGLDTLSRVFRLCNPMVAANEVNQMYGWIRNALTTLAMLDYPYATEFIGHLPAHPVNVACSYMLQNSNNSLDGLVAVNALLYNGTGSEKCSDMYADYMPCADPTGCGNLISWDYQACTEVTLPSGTDGVAPSMFPNLPFTPKMRTTYCEMKYNVTPRTDWLDINMWGDDIDSATNIVFTNGDLDPWRRGGLTKSVGALEYYLIEGGAHHLDLRGSHNDDPQSVIDVRGKELQAIKRWLKEHQRRQINK